jgi:hypothetical protein
MIKNKFELLLAEMKEEDLKYKNYKENDKR